MSDKHALIREPEKFKESFRLKRNMASGAFKSFSGLVIDNVELHSKTLASVDRDRLMVDNSEKVLVGCYSDNNSIKSDGFELVSSQVK